MYSVYLYLETNIIEILLYISIIYKNIFNSNVFQFPPRGEFKHNNNNNNNNNKNISYFS